jgi:uncharacterized protein (TIGR02391 family)
MAKGRLDKNLLDKIASKLGRKQTAINVKVSKKAAKLGISSEAALIVLAKELGIGSAIYQRKLDSAKQAEVRDSLPTVFAEVKTTKRKMPTSGKSQVKRYTSKRTILRTAIEYLLQDEELRERCGDLLAARANFDRAINQATLVLEDRIRAKSQPAKRLVGENLVGYAFNANLAQTVLQISINSDEQRGFTSILRGIVPTFRNLTHHHVTDTFTREEALRVCAFIDVLLKVVDNSKKVK